MLRNVGVWGWTIFTLVWFSAVVGIILSFGTLKANNHLKTASYVLMGLLIFIAIKPLIQVAVAENCVAVLYWLAAGGAFYIVGAVFYALAKKEFIHAENTQVLAGQRQRQYSADNGERNRKQYHKWIQVRLVKRYHVEF